MTTKLCVCSHSENDHGLSETMGRCCYWSNGNGKDYQECDCSNFNPARAEEVQPNDCGVYPEEAAECIRFAIGKAAHQRGEATCEIHLLQVGEEWLLSTDCSFYLGDYNGASGPLSRDIGYPHRSRSEALLAALDRCLDHFHTRDRDGCATPKQVEISRKMHAMILEYKARVGGAEVAAALPVGTQLDLFGGAA